MAAIRACISHELELSRRNADGLNPYESIPDEHPGAEAAKEAFPMEWRERYFTIQANRNRHSPAKIEKERIAALMAEQQRAADEFAARAEVERKREIEERNVKRNEVTLDEILARSLQALNSTLTEGNPSTKGQRTRSAPAQPR